MDAPRPGLPHTREALPQDLPRIRTLLYTHPQVYFFPGWDPLDQWPGFQPFVVLTRGSNVAAALAATLDNPRTAWLRLLAWEPTLDRKRAWAWLWPALYQNLVRRQVAWIMALGIFPWMEELYRQSGFYQDTRVITLEWRPQASIPRLLLPPDVYLREMQVSDLTEVARVDAQAFSPPWQLGLDAVQRMFPYLMLRVVVQVDRRIVGYLAATPAVRGAHIARLAVEPAWQGQGIGRALVTHALLRLQAQGVERVTVNTKEENHPALHLYARLGFRTTRQIYPVWKRDLMVQPDAPVPSQATHAWMPPG